jgi:hypothetical protein
MSTGFSWGNTKEKGHLEDLVADGRIILKLALKMVRRILD